jgi:antitoxin component YwqK of YwqJK toxin-antitoxin module
MTKHAVLLLGVFVGMCAFPVLSGNDQGGDTNQIDDKGQKQGRWIYFGKDKPTLGYPAEGKVEEGDYKDNRKEGTWIKYHTDGKTPKLKGEYHNNRPDGAYEKIYPDGTVKERGTFTRGKYSGSLERYYPNGQLKYKGNHNGDGMEEGQIVYYHPNGQEEFVYEAVDGKPTGKATRYYENGDIKEVITFGADGKPIEKEFREPVNPIKPVTDPEQSRERAPAISTPRTKGRPFKPNGYNKVYNENDEIWQDGDFRNGSLYDGKVYEYDSDGILLKVRVFKNGFYHSDGQL